MRKSTLNINARCKKSCYVNQIEEDRRKGLLGGFKRPSRCRCGRMDERSSDINAVSLALAKEQPEWSSPQLANIRVGCWCR